MEDIIQLKDQFYVLATSSLADQRTRVLRQGLCFAVFDTYGNIQPIGNGSQGFYDGSTRFLSGLELKLGKLNPLFLSSTVRGDNTLLTVDLMNRDSADGEAHALPGTLHVFRSKFLWHRACYERVRVTNYGTSPAEVDLSYSYKADFADIFEIRGSKRPRRGERLPSELGQDFVVLGYRGLDEVIRRTRIEFSPPPAKLTEGEAHFRFLLEPQAHATFFMGVISEGTERTPYPPYSQAYVKSVRAIKQNQARDCIIETENPEANEWLARSAADLHMMLTKTDFGLYPYAGVPLFNTIFGRDGLITAYQSLWNFPEIARGVLNYLAHTQAREKNDFQDAEPGKILHEVRSGEMVAMGEVPFQLYYGSIDSTPLFLILAASYFQRTGDREFLQSIWLHIELALEWIDRYGDIDGDGFVEYYRRSPRGLVNQGWKDSFDSIFHQNGQLAEGPMALCEIQGYVFDAKRRMAALYEMFGQERRARELREQADSLRRRFEEKFWCEELGTYALALDGEKRPCRIRSSNAGHALFSGIASDERAKILGKSLFSDTMFSGWGIRTVATSESRYNPMSYHNGSVWPHDNSLIGDGLARYALKPQVNRLLTGLFDAAGFMDQQRLPELFCGFVRRIGEGPTLYPVACSPQSWASASVFLLLKAAWGLFVQGDPPRVTFTYPSLPESIGKVSVRNLAVGEGTIDFELCRHRDGDVGVNILQRVGPVEVFVIK